MSSDLRRQLDAIHVRIGELDSIMRDLEAERAQLRNQADNTRAALAAAAAAAADTPTVSMRAKPVGKGKR